MALSSLLYPMYERRLARQLDKHNVPRHIGVILDGNRRWAKALGTPAFHGHQKGADKISELLTWSADAGVDVVTLWMLSTDNLSRSSDELSQLLDIICGAVDKIADDGRWRLRVAGALELLPEAASTCLAEAEARNRRSGVAKDAMVVNVAVGYGGRHEITDAVRNFLRSQAASGRELSEVADSLTVEDITAHLYTAGLPDPDLVIRTSGEQRLGGFLLWQSVHSEYYFCEAYWPDFRRTDFLRALRDYGQRERRMGR
ncbi:short-chain Z-isoprenyl diphosphate synthase [Bowdeniella nasicola]|uniref:Isoprenyl transferase n=1 Tax=Bowdeniella nasicola TaxID=208480 RepID=A0A1H4A4T0_9ACTO|nr:isoprenyl transferase [Bowdeniella nasicola]SEA30562.1 short-chain Z-isoprenyl diphosphate synthase [Bowdeniella nasicola]